MGIIGTLRSRLAVLLAGQQILGATTAVATSTAGRPIPLRRGHGPALRLPASLVTHLAAIRDRECYPEWHSRRKTKGRRDASLRSRSNRRKAAR